MVLYLISVGLSVTMGMMGFVNLAHGVFAMLGGYIVTSLMSRQGVPFALALVSATVLTALGSVVIERLLYRPLYGGDDLDQVLLTIGLVFMSVAAVTYVWGATPQPMHPPRWLVGEVDLGLRSFPAYRSFLILCGGGLVTALWLWFEPPAVWDADPGGGRQSAHGAISRYQHLAPFHVDLCAGQRARRARRRPRRRSAVDQPELRARQSGLFLDRRRGWGPRQHSRPVCRGTGHRHRRYRLQVFAARTRRVLHLSGDDGD